MVRERKRKTNHLIPADRVGSAAKAGVWFGEKERFKDIQAQIMEKVKDKIDWLPLSDAILAVSAEPPGIVVIASNPTLPGVIILGDAASMEATQQIQDRFTELVSGITDEMNIETHIGEAKPQCGNN